MRSSDSRLTQHVLAASALDLNREEYATSVVSRHQYRALIDGVQVLASSVKQLRRIGIANFDRQSLELLYKLRHLSVDRLNTFMGLAFNKSNQVWIVWKFEAKCTLREVVNNDDFDLNEQFQTSFLNDIVRVRRKL